MVCDETIENVSTNEDYILWRLLTQTRNAILKVRKKELAAYHVSNRHAACLFIVRASGGKATPSEIARWLVLEPHSVSEILKRMEKKGLIERGKDLDNKKIVRVTLTEKGREAYYQAAKLESIHKIMSSLSKKQHQQLKAYLRILRNEVVKELGIKGELPYPPLR